MAIALVEVKRSGVVESRHYGSVAVVNGKGELIASAGDPNFVTFIRSAAKPMQALNVIFSGALEHYGFSEKELAIMCSSHYGEDMHRQVIEGVLAKIGLERSNLLCGTPMSIKAAYRDRQLSEHLPITELNSDCSGKHSGFLSVCCHKGYPIENYTDPNHPMQQEVLGIVAKMCGMAKEDICIGVDGCGVPVHGLPLKNMAMGYARLTTGAQLEEPYRSACARIVAAMNAHPEMIAGEGGFCTEFMRHTHGRFCGKVGAEAVYCIGVKDRDLGIAVKIEDGGVRALYPAVMSTLEQLGLLEEAEKTALKNFAEIPNKNDHGKIVGSIGACFRLEMHK